MNSRPADRSLPGQPVGAARYEGQTGRENTDDWDLGREIDLDDLRTGTLAADGSLTVELADGKNRLVFRPEGR